MPIFSGKKVINKEKKLVDNSPQTLDVLEMPQGIYFLNIVTEQKSQAIKISKE